VKEKNMNDNVSQYEFTLLEIAKLFLKEKRVTSGLWTVGCNFTVGAMLAGPDPQNVVPAMMVGVEKIVLVRSTETTPLTVDASTL
jgi:hypothetical protein